MVNISPQSFWPGCHRKQQWPKERSGGRETQRHGGLTFFAHKESVFLFGRTLGCLFIYIDCNFFFINQMVFSSYNLSLAWTWAQGRTSRKDMLASYGCGWQVRHIWRSSLLLFKRIAWAPNSSSSSEWLLHTMSPMNFQEKSARNWNLWDQNPWFPDDFPVKQIHPWMHI